MSLYISDEHGLGLYEMVMVVRATITIEDKLECFRRQCADRFPERREIVRPRFNKSRWALPKK